MVTIVNNGYDENFVRLRGLSTDNKPTDVPNGSEFLEMDTCTVKYFDADAGEWI